MLTPRNCSALTWGVSDTTVGAASLVSVIAAGSAALSTLTLLDGTAIKIVLPIQITAGAQLTFPFPVNFTNLIADMTGTAGYTIIYQPKP